MATIQSSWYAYGGTAWNSSSTLYSGVSGGNNYRSKIQIKLESFTGQSNSLVVSLTTSGTCSPAGCYAVLSTNGNIAVNNVVSDTYYSSYTNGPHPSYLAPGCSGYIAESDSYSNSACTTLMSSYNQSSGTKVYFKFNSTALTSGGTYYLYVMRYIKSGDSTTSGWTKFTTGGMSVTLNYTPRYTLTLNKGDGVYSFTGASANALKGNTIAATATTYPGYVLQKYEGTLHDGSGNSSWTGCAGLTSHSDNWTMNANRTITVSATKASYTVTYNPEGGSVSPTSSSLTYGNGNYTSHPTPTRTGYDFKGWYADIKSDGPVQLGIDYRYTTGLNVGFDAYRDNWASWGSSTEVFISCTNNGGWNLFVRDGQLESDPWDTGTKSYKTTANIYNLKTLSAGWHHFDMKFISNRMYFYIDGTQVGTSATFSGSLGLNATSCLWLGAEASGGISNDGSVFQGKIGNVRILNTNPSTAYPTSVFVTPAQNMTLHARWELKTYEVSYNANGGNTTPDSQLKTHGVNLTLRGAITKPDSVSSVRTTFDANGGTVSPSYRNTNATQKYVFRVWKDNNNNEYPSAGVYTINASTTMTAQWSDGDLSGASCTLPVPARAGYTFDGWYTASTGGTKITSHYPTSNNTLYAHWIPNNYKVIIYCERTGRTLVSLDKPCGSSVLISELFEYMPTEYVYTGEGEGGAYFWCQTDPSNAEAGNGEYNSYAGDFEYAYFYNGNILNDDYYGSSYHPDEYFIMPPQDIELTPELECAWLGRLKVQAPELPLEWLPSGKYLKYWENEVSGIRITPGSYGEYEGVYEGEWFYGVLGDDTQSEMFIKHDGNYYNGTIFYKLNGEYVNVDECLIKYQGSWITLRQYLIQHNLLG